MKVGVMMWFWEVKYVEIVGMEFYALFSARSSGNFYRSSWNDDLLLLHVGQSPNLCVVTLEAATAARNAMEPFQMLGGFSTSPYRTPYRTHKCNDWKWNDGIGWNVSLCSVYFMYFMHLPHLTAGMHVIFEFFLHRGHRRSFGDKSCRTANSGSSWRWSHRRKPTSRWVCFPRWGGDKLQQLTAFFFFGGGGVGKIKAKIVTITYLLRETLHFSVWDVGDGFIMENFSTQASVKRPGKLEQLKPGQELEGGRNNTTKNSSKPRPETFFV